ncbi:hypothetical protein ACFQER_10460 [Halomicroarcula sp. GCM10025894]
MPVAEKWMATSAGSRGQRAIPNSAAKIVMPAASESERDQAGNIIGWSR